MENSIKSDEGKEPEWMNEFGSLPLIDFFIGIAYDY